MGRGKRGVDGIFPGKRGRRRWPPFCAKEFARLKAGVMRGEPEKTGSE